MITKLGEWLIKRERCEFPVLLLCAVLAVPFLCIPSQFTSAQLLEVEEDTPPDRAFVLMLGGRAYRVDEADVTNGAVVFQSGYATSDNRDFYLGLAFLTGGLGGARIIYVGLDLTYFFGEYPDDGFFLRGDLGFAQLTEEFGQLNAPISTGFGAHIAAGYSLGLPGGLPPVQLALVQGYYDLDQNYSPPGLQISVMF